MKSSSIKIMKFKPNDNSNESAIGKSRDSAKRRKSGGSFMGKVTMLVILVAFLGSTRPGTLGRIWPGRSNKVVEGIHDEGMQLSTIMTGGVYLMHQRSLQDGETGAITITITNASTQPIYVCDSSTVYQDHAETSKGWSDTTVFEMAIVPII